MDNATVKLDSELLNRVKQLLKKSPHKILYTNLKQFVNIAVLQLLEKESSRKSSKLKSDSSREFK